MMLPIITDNGMAALRRDALRLGILSPPCTTATANNPPPMSRDTILADMKRIMGQLKTIPPAPTIRVSALCEGQPRMQLAPQGIGPGMVFVSDEVRAETNAWMLAFFGKEPDRVLSVTDPLTGRKTIFMSQRDYDRLPGRVKGGF